MGSKKSVAKRTKRKRHLSEISLNVIKLHRYGPLYVTDLNLYTKRKGSIEGIYFVFDAMYNLRYIGESKSIFERVVRHNRKRRASMYSIAIFLTKNLTQNERKYIEETFFHLYRNSKLDFGRQPISIINMMKLRDSGHIEKKLPYEFYDWSLYKEFVKTLPRKRNRTPLQWK